jgi:glycerophosphoryl diester phosphodiesterase
VEDRVIPELIAHRGEPESWPENSLAGYEAVLRAGARYIETDVQITADGVPILSHDPSLLKITGQDYQITKTAYPVICDLPAGYPDKFAERFSDLRITRLDEFTELLARWPGVTAFVEVKQATVEARGGVAAVDIILEQLARVVSQCVLISFDYAALIHIRGTRELPVGWVIPEWSENNRQWAEELQPDYLFCNRKRLPPETEPLWQGSWRWVVYTINTADDVLAFGNRGSDLVETNVISQLLNNPQLAGSGHD